MVKINNVSKLRIFTRLKSVSLSGYGLDLDIEIPEWVVCLAIDKDGLLYGFRNDNIEIELNSGTWVYPDYFKMELESWNYYCYIGKVDYEGDWIESKITLD